MASKSIRERMRERRERIQDTQVNQDDDEDEIEADKRTRIKSGEKSTGPDLNMTWDAAVAELTATTGSELSDDEVKEEIKRASTLQEDLKTKHRERKRELKQMRARREEDIKEQMKTAKEKSRDKLERSLRARRERDTVDAADGGVVEETIEAAEAATAEESAPGLARRGSREPLIEGADEEAAAKSKAKSLNATIRERLRNKVSKAREKAETEAMEESGKRRLRGLRDRPTATRFDDAQFDESRDERLIQSARERLQKARWKREEDQDKTKKPTTKIISSEEAMDFFCRDWEPEVEQETEAKAEDEAKPETEAKPEGEEEPKPGTSGEAAEGEEDKDKEDKPEGEETEEPKEGEEGEDKKKTKKGKKKTGDKEPLLSDGEDDEEWGYTAVRKAQYTDYKEQQEKEKKEFYIPSMIAIPDQSKIDEKLQPRYLADEGIYVGTRPAVSYRNENKLEDRLLHEPDGHGRKWFGEDGKIQILPDPLKKTPTRPVIAEETNPLIDTVYVGAFTREMDPNHIDGRADLLGQRYQLDVDLNRIAFTHHHLFSREHVLASRLRSLHAEYLFRTSNDIVNYYSQKLRALKQAALHLREAIVNHKHNQTRPSNALVELEKRLKDYCSEIKMIRAERDSEQNRDRVLIKNIIKTWKEIKSLRELQNCVNTTVKLQIRREATDKEAETQDWNAEIEDEIEEQKMEHQEEYIRKQAQYNELLEKSRVQQQNKKDAQKRQKKREKKKVEDMTPEEQEEEIADQQIIAEDAVHVPDPPVAFDEAGARDVITSKAKRIRRNPGEPKLDPKLMESATITTKNQCPRGERDRRDDVDRYKCFVKVFVNNKEVARTQAKPLSQDFSISFARILNVQIVSWPESVRLEIHESAGFSVDCIAELYLPIPEHSVTSKSVQLEDMDFSSDQKIAHKHEGVGSGTLFTFDAEGTNLLSLMTTGILATSLCWAIDESGNAMIPPSHNKSGLFSAFKHYDALGALGAAGSVNMEKLTKWIIDSRLDPNDPRNADLVYLMKPSGTGDQLYGQVRMPDYFRLEQLQEEFDLVSDEQLESDPRFRLIQYRDQEVAEFRNYKMIPSYSKDIPVDIFKEYERKRKEESMDRIRDIESHRAQVQRFMQQVRERVLQRFRILSHQKTFSSMVIEEDVPQIGTLLPTLMKLTEARRPLRPVRKERKKVTAQNLDGIDVKILVNIIRANNVPVRVDVSDEAEKGRRKKQPTVKPVVEILFQNETYRTAVAGGPNPSWNEEIQIQFHPPNNDISPSNLQTVKDVLYFNLFDEVEVNLLEDDRQKQDQVHSRKERKYLGSLKIPFSTLYLNSKIEGTFRVTMPPVLLGYTHQVSTTRDPGLGEEREIGIGETDQSYLSIFVTIEPQLSLPEPVQEKFDTTEDEHLVDQADRWMMELEKKFPRREYRTMVTDINGRSVFMTRYFRAIKPPSDVIENESMQMKPEERIARYVSLIPFVADSLVFPGLCDIWSTCDQFMNMLAGDEEEHAVLLTNYFLHQGKQAWLVIGSAIPEGPTAYVLTAEDDKDFLLWNASTGEHFSYKNSYCPLKRIGCVVNEENIWANIQTSDEPAKVKFDFTNTQNWKPFFTSSNPNPGLSSVQPSSLDYLRTEKAYVGDLQDKIERTLRDKIMQWRPRNITRWNRNCMKTFRELLVKFEENGGASMRNQSVPELDQILKTYKMTGFPINMPFTDIEPIIESVYSTGLHDLDTNDVEYALAVYVCPYPNSILSVWIYVASLVRKR